MPVLYPKRITLRLLALAVCLLGLGSLGASGVWSQTSLCPLSTARETDVGSSRVQQQNRALVRERNLLLAAKARLDPDDRMLLTWHVDNSLRDWQGVFLEPGSEQHVIWLDLGNNQLQGTIPPELGNLTRLERLDLGDNQLQGAIPPELGNLTMIRHS